VEIIVGTENVRNSHKSNILVEKLEMRALFVSPVPRWK